MKLNKIQTVFALIIASWLLVILVLLGFAWGVEYFHNELTWIDNNPVFVGSGIIVFVCCVLFVLNRR